MLIRSKNVFEKKIDEKDFFFIAPPEATLGELHVVLSDIIGYIEKRVAEENKKLEEEKKEDSEEQEQK